MKNNKTIQNLLKENDQLKKSNQEWKEKYLILVEKYKTDNESNKKMIIKCEGLIREMTEQNLQLTKSKIEMQDIRMKYLELLNDTRLVKSNLQEEYKNRFYKLIDKIKK